MSSPSFQRKYGVLLAGEDVISIPIIKRGAADYAVGADWTPAAGDVRVKVGSGAWANITNLPTASGAGGNGASALWDFVLTAAELQAKRVRVMISDAATKAIEDQMFEVETFGHASALYPSDPTANNIDAEARFLRAVKTNILGTVASNAGNSQTTLYTTGLDPAPTSLGQFSGRVILFAADTLTAALRGSGAPILSITAAGVITIDTPNQLPAIPQAGDTFAIL